MANFLIDENQETLELELRKIETSDPVHADIYNALFQKLINNDAFLERLADKMIRQAMISHVLDSNNAGMVLGADVGPKITTITDALQRTLDVLDTNDAYLKQEMDATNRAVNALRNDKTITIPAFTQSAAPYTADIEVQHLKTTDAIELYAGMIKSDSELTVAQKAEKIKIRRKYLNMIDNAECNTDGILTVTSYSKKPATEFAVWLRGCSAEEK